MSAYAFRIMGCLPEQSPVELLRSSLPYNPTYWNSHRLPRPWRCYVEHTLRDQDCITPRIRLVMQRGKVTLHPRKGERL